MDKDNHNPSGKILAQEEGFGFVFQVVVVVGQLRLWVGLVRIFECFRDVVLADDFEPQGLAQRAVVDHIPALNFPFVATYNAIDVVAQPREQSVAGEEIALVVAEPSPEPGCARPDCARR